MLSAEVLAAAAGAGAMAGAAGVTVEVNDNLVTVKGKLGQLTQEYSDITVKIFYRS